MCLLRGRALLVPLESPQAMPGYQQGTTFWESHARDMRAKGEDGSTVPRKMVLNWFMPALANSKVGSFSGTTLLLGTCKPRIVLGSGQDNS